MVKTRSSATSYSSSHRPPCSSLAPPRKSKRRRTAVMADRKKKLRRQKAPQKRASIPLALTEERAIGAADGYPQTSSFTSRTFARKKTSCYSGDVPASYCSRKTSSKQADAATAEKFSEICNSSKRNRKFGSSSQSSSTKTGISESVETCTEGHSSDCRKEASHENGWTSEQDAALQYAYFQVRPSSNFWFQVSKKVPGKTAKDCFDRFYSAHPTPPITQPRAKKVSAESPVRTITFASPMSSINCKGGLGRGKQGLLKAHKTVRHILRRQKVADGAYEADIFSAVEPLGSRDALLQSCMGKAISPLPALKGRDSESYFITPANRSGYGTSGYEVWRSASSKQRSRFNHDHNQDIFGSASQISLLSPEVLKVEQNPGRLDRFLDILHLRRAHRRKSSSSLKGTCQDQEPMNSESTSTKCVAAAREAIVTHAEEVLRTSFQRQLSREEETGFSSDQAEDDSSMLSEQ